MTMLNSRLDLTVCEDHVFLSSDCRLLEGRVFHPNAPTARSGLARQFDQNFAFVPTYFIGYQGLTAEIVVRNRNFLNLSLSGLHKRNLLSRHQTIDDLAR